MEYCHIIVKPKYRAIWSKSYWNNIGRLTQGMSGRVKGTNTMLFIYKADIPADQCKDVMYDHIVVSYRPKNEYPNHTRLPVVGDRVNYTGDFGTPTIYLLTVKLLLNSTISTPGACLRTLNIEDFYLMTPMERYKYMILKLADLPEDVIKQYNLR